MNCRKVQNLISAYVDCELPGVEMLAMRQHLSDCPECNSEFEALLRVKRAYGSLAPKTPSPVLAARILYVLDGPPHQPQKHALPSLWKRFTFFPGKLGFAAASMVIFATLLTLTSGQLFRDSYAYLPLPQPVQMIALAEQDPVRLFPTTNTMEGAPPASKLTPAPSGEPNVGSSESGQPMHLTGNANTIFASYSVTRW